MWQRFLFLLWAAMMLLPGIDSASAAQAQNPDQPARKAQRAIERAFGANDLVAESIEADDVADTEVSRDRFEKRLAWQINRLDQVYGLTAEQKKKLEIAGRGDIKRLFERIREKEVTLRRLEEDFQRAREQGNAARLLTAMREVRDRTKGLPEKLFIEGSIFVKTLKSTFHSEQRKKYEKDQLDFYRSRVEWAVVGGLGTLKLSDDQSRRFVIQIVEQTRPLRRYGRYDFQAVLIQASRLPEKTLKPIFDDRQWRRLLAGFEEVKRLEQEIIAGGYLPEDEVPPARAAAHGLPEQDRSGALPG